MKDQPSLGLGVLGCVLPFLNRFDGSFGEDRISSGDGSVFNSSVRRDGCVHTHITANANAFEILRVFRIEPVNNFSLILFDLLLGLNALSAQFGRSERRKDCEAAEQSEAKRF